ncbi:hypothetical protein GSI_07554 [Ganoderma sinense ZZ0214-1]|uniref:Uncharacterized protein n=1 Tax=Ganoderma sinense ZZ0214-1 TaxID=1077348 RepID=A0A2G8S9D6_9APHY|nr:hypothetical protein GSI_07554 [Ganoderma sinense ZZ0214-1]
MRIYDGACKLPLKLGGEDGEGAAPRPVEEIRPEIDQSDLRKLLLDAIPSHLIRWVISSDPAEANTVPRKHFAGWSKWLLNLIECCNDSDIYPCPLWTLRCRPDKRGRGHHVLASRVTYFVRGGRREDGLDEEA